MTDRAGRDQPPQRRAGQAVDQTTHTTAADEPLFGIGRVFPHSLQLSERWPLGQWAFRPVRYRLAGDRARHLLGGGVEAVEEIGRGDRRDTGGQSLLVVVPGGLVPDRVEDRVGPIGETGGSLNERQGSPFGIAEGGFCISSSKSALGFFRRQNDRALEAAQLARSGALERQTQRFKKIPVTVSSLAGWFTLCAQSGHPTCPSNPHPEAVFAAFRAATPLLLQLFLDLTLIIPYLYPLGYIGLGLLAMPRSPWLATIGIAFGWLGSIAWGFIADGILALNTAIQLGQDASFAALEKG